MGLGCRLVQRHRCSVCLQLVDLGRADGDMVTAALFGALRYSICSCCHQEKKRPWSATYKKRWEAWLAVDMLVENALNALNKAKRPTVR